MNNKLYCATDHDHHWRMGVASIVVAPTELDARRLLDGVLIENGLMPWAQKEYTLISLPLDKAAAYILSGGNC